MPNRVRNSSYRIIELNSRRLPCAHLERMAQDNEASRPEAGKPIDSRSPPATAKRLHEITDVPRTRVYDAVGVLAEEGLVELQESNPQQYRAVTLEEAIETLSAKFNSRLDRLETAIEAVKLDEVDEGPAVQEVWALSGGTAIANRTNRLIEQATDEIVFVMSDADLVTPKLIAALNDVGDGVDLIIGAATPELQSQIQAEVPTATTYLSGLNWLQGPEAADEAAIGRLLLVDRATILVSSTMPDTNVERAMCAEGFRNGLIVIARRLLAQGLMTNQDTDP